eukprot:761786-Hanusia_phi.AAC.2
MGLFSSSSSSSSSAAAAAARLVYLFDLLLRHVLTETDVVLDAGKEDDGLLSDMSANKRGEQDVGEVGGGG